MSASVVDRFHGKVALVTGAGAGIGAAIAERLFQEGAIVLCADRDGDAARDVAARLASTRAESILLDVSDATQWGLAMERCLNRHGGLHILVNNAGIIFPALPVQETSLEDFERLIAINLRGVFLGCKYGYPLLKETRGCVLNISSMAGVTGQGRHAVYAATKGAINALTKSTAVDLSLIHI